MSFQSALRSSFLILGLSLSLSCPSQAEDIDTLELELRSFGIQFSQFPKIIGHLESGSAQTKDSQEAKFRASGVLARMFSSKEEDKKNFEDLKRVKLTILSNLYKPQPTPYSGLTTSLITCPKEFEPELIQLSAGTLFVAKTNNEDTFGGCDSKKSKNHGLYGIFYDDHAKKIKQVYIFIDARRESDWTALLKVIREVRFN